MVTVLVGKYDVWIPLYPIVALGACLYAGFACRQGTFAKVFSGRLNGFGFEVFE